MIKFLGLDSGFGNFHTNAFFKTNKSLVYIDLSGTNMEKAKNLLNENLDKEIYMLITHMHADHISGIPIFTQYAYFVQNKIIKFIIPERLENDFETFMKITGISEDIFNIETLEEFDNRLFSDFRVEAISTYHCNELIGKCFGYLIEINKEKYLYTGDTAKIKDFEPYLCDIKSLYIDTSVNYGKVHLKLDEILNYFGDSPSFDIYLMHLDDKKKAEEIIKNKEKYHIGEII